MVSSEGGIHHSLCHLNSRRDYWTEEPKGWNMIQMKDEPDLVGYIGGVRVSYLKSPRSKNRNVKERISRHRKGSANKKN